MQFDQFQAELTDLYEVLNQYRTWFNGHVANYEIFLEDNWFEAHTTIEYTFRCLDTFNILVVAEDDYLNSRDEKGVWHLGQYQSTRWTVEQPWEEIMAFFAENTMPVLKQ